MKSAKAETRNGAVFLDTGILVALLNAKDQWHNAATALFESGNPAWHTSYLVLSESYSFFLHRYGEEPTRTLRKFVAALPNVTVHPADQTLHQNTYKMLDRLRGARLSYVDASSLCLLRTHKIKTVWSTDHHLGLTGAEVLPRAQ